MTITQHHQTVQRGHAGLPGWRLVRTWRRAMATVAIAAMLASCAGDDGSATTSLEETTIADTPEPATDVVTSAGDDQPDIDQPDIDQPDIGGTEVDATTTTLLDDDSESEGSVTDVVTLSVLQAEGTRIVDAEGREVLLRGVNITSLGEYWQGDPDHEPTQPMTDADWDAMAAMGFSVIRLIVSWSRLEPERGTIDEDYLDEIEAYVDAAADHGMYTVIDMHQDGYSSVIFTPDGQTCPEGTEPAKGWDGAPSWATITDGLDTCLTNGRNSSPAVIAAWNHFYDNTDGIRDHFATTWGAVAAHFAGRPEVAGYNLLNEPEVSRPSAEITPLYEQLIVDTVRAIRNAETAAGASFEQLVIVEPGLPTATPSHGFVIPDPAGSGIADPAVSNDNIVAGPHNYAESIDQTRTIEGTNELFITVAAGLDIPTWVGEYGWWDISEESLEEVGRMAIDMDTHRLGGAWWQWRQPCGDPHTLNWGQTWSERTPEEVVHLNTIRCPGDDDLGLTEPFAEVLRRAYPRATPGNLTELDSDWQTGSLRMQGTGATAGTELIVWIPADATGEPDGEGIERIESTAVEGGRIVTATVTKPDYTFTLNAP